MDQVCIRSIGRTRRFGRKGQRRKPGQRRRPADLSHRSSLSQSSPLPLQLFAPRDPSPETTGGSVPLSSWCFNVKPLCSTYRSKFATAHIRTNTKCCALLTTDRLGRNHRHKIPRTMGKRELERHRSCKEQILIISCSSLIKQPACALPLKPFGQCKI